MDEVHSTDRARRRARLIKLGGVTAGVAAAALALSACSSSSSNNSGGAGASGGGGGGKKVGVALILKTLTNPYFVSMEKDAKTAASQNNVNLSVAAGKTDGDTQTQIAAIDNAISRGDKGILITINGDAVNTEISKARKAGLYVIALDTAPTPPDTSISPMRPTTSRPAS
jgi:fructose transport system substrate-binding protein